MVISRPPGFHFLSPGFWAKTIFCCFFKTITQIRFISFIYYILWNGVTLDNFSSFYFFFFSSIPLLPCCFWEKTFSPLCTAFQIRCTAAHSWHAVKSLNISEFRNVFSGWLWTVKKKKKKKKLKYDLTSYYKVTC